MVLKKDLATKELRRRVESGYYPRGAKLPSGVELAAELGVSHITIRAALSLLADEGLLTLIHGRGTFVPGVLPGESRAEKILIVISPHAGIENPFQYILPEFLTVCAARGASCEMIGSDFLRRGTPRKIAEQLRKSGFTAAILASSFYNGDENEVLVLRELGIPVLLPHGYPSDAESTGFATFYPEEAKAWRKGLEYISSQGHERVGLLLGKADDLIGVRGYKKEEHYGLLKEFGFHSKRDWIAFAEYSTEGVRSAVDAFFSGKEHPSIIYCFSDFFAILLYAVLAERKLRVPEDVSVLGFCGYPGGTLLTPSLTTIDLEYTAIGRAAANMLLASKDWHSKKIPFSKGTSFHLEKRGSVVPRQDDIQIKKKGA